LQIPMGTAHTRPVAEFPDAYRALKKSELTLIQNKFYELSKNRDLKAGKVDKVVFIDQILTPQFGRNLGEAALDRIFFVLDHSANNYFLDWQEFCCALYLLWFSVREEKFRLLFNVFDISAQQRITKREFKKMAVALMQGAGERKEMERKSKLLSPLADMFVSFTINYYDLKRHDQCLNYNEWRRFAEEDEIVLSVIADMKALNFPSATASPSPSPIPLSAFTALPSTAPSSSSSPSSSPQPATTTATAAAIAGGSSVSALSSSPIGPDNDSDYDMRNFTFSS